MRELARLFRPPSLAKLVWFGFFLTTLPLMLAMVSAIYSVDELNRYGKLAVYRAVQTTQQSRTLLDKLTAMERSAKQFLVLDDPAFFQTYVSGHDEFVDSIHDLIEIADQELLWLQMKELAALEFELFRQLDSDLDRKTKSEITVDGFNQLNTLADDLWQKSTLLFRKEVDELDQKSQALQHKMLINSGILLPISLILVVVFVFLIVRPIRQLDVAIRRLGRGDFEKNIQVSGPKDLEYLGSRLDWLRHRLKELEEDKQRFLRNVSHELKTPLATIHEGVELLADEVVGELNSEQADIAEILINSSRRLDKLIEDLLNYSHIQSQQGEFVREEINLKELILLLINDYQLNLRANHIRVNVSLEDVLIFAVVDKLHTAIDNLMSNAVKYSPEQGEIRIWLENSNGSVLFEIEDDGPGIPAEERNKVFDVFYQGVATRKAGIKGTGLGLAIVTECVAIHHGKVAVLDPKKPGAGARFQIWIPRDLRRNRR